MTLKEIYSSLVSLGIYLNMKMPEDYLESDVKEKHFAALVEACKIIKDKIEREV